MPDGSTFEFVERPANPETGDLVMEFGLEPDCPAPPPHVHTGGQTEIFECVEGSFELLVGKEWRKLVPGEKIEVEPGTRHTFRNRSGARVKVRNVHSPAHSFENYMRRLHAVVTAAGGARSPKVAIAIAQLWRDHPDTIAPSDAPMKVAMPLLARIGDLAGVKPPEPTP